MTKDLNSLPMYLGFNDLSILPGNNQGNVDDIPLTSRFTRNINLNVPLVSAAMPCVTEVAMAKAMIEFGGVGIIHRYMDINKQCEMVKAIREHKINKQFYPDASYGPDGNPLTAASVDPQDIRRAEMLADAGVHVLVFDTPNPGNKENLEGAKKIRDSVDVDLVTGQIVNPETAIQYLDLGVDALRIGLGAGALCSIRLITAMGAPQATAIYNCYQIAKSFNIPIISDGGIQTSGDIVKAFALGAESIITGSLLMGCDETPGEIVNKNDKRWKRVAGLNLDFIEIPVPTGYPKIDEYLENHEIDRIEGGEGLVLMRGTVHLVLLRLVRGIRAGIYMAGVKSVNRMKTDANLIRVSPAGLLENRIRI